MELNKGKTIRHQMLYSDTDFSLCYMILFFMEGDRIIESAIIQLSDNFNIHDEISKYQFYAYSLN